MRKLFEKPVFIMAAPRSGSTLLFETLSRCKDLWTIGGESHLIFEGLPQLRPDLGKTESNRLTAEHATADIKQSIKNGFISNLRDYQGKALDVAGISKPVRMLEKTPKNSLRIPFINAIFPDALFIFLYRDPRENISSIIDAWNAGNWVTYPRLNGWNRPWSLLLPPGWPSMREKSLGEIAAFQWESANRYILNDLARISPRRWTTISYTALLNSPKEEIRRICADIGVCFDNGLQEVTGQNLPLSCYTLSPPSPDKWKKNEDSILPVLDSIMPTQNRICLAEESHRIIPEENRDTQKTGRNDPCPCGSGKKYKKCHG